MAFGTPSGTRGWCSWTVAGCSRRTPAWIGLKQGQFQHNFAWQFIQLYNS